MKCISRGDAAAGKGQVARFAGIVRGTAYAEKHGGLLSETLCRVLFRALDRIRDGDAAAVFRKRDAGGSFVLYSGRSRRNGVLLFHVPAGGLSR